MKTVVLISCSKLKRQYPCEARLLYDESNLFNKSLAYAQSISKNIYVLSAKHGLVHLDDIIAPYDESLLNKSSDELSVWGKNTAKQISDKYDISKTEFIILAGQNYYKPLRPYIPNINLPLIGLPIGERLAKLDVLLGKTSVNTESMCYRLHRILNKLPRYKWDDINKIVYDSGIYIVFETGERYCNMDRIVRVGSHRSNGRLRGRLKDHFINENNDGSIFRKNIGRAILNKNKNPYLIVWRKNSSRTDANYNAIMQNKVEKHVTKYMREHFSFSCFPVESNTERLRLELGIIASLNKDADFIPSHNWRGKYSSEYEIVNSGMWLKEGLEDSPLTENEYERVKFLCNVCEEQVLLPHIYQKKESPQNEKTHFIPTHTKKYAPLTVFLSRQNIDEVKLSLEEIEKILNSSLPASAYKHTPWWNNYDETHSHRLGWINAGFRVMNGSSIKSTKTVIFSRKK